MEFEISTAGYFYDDENKRQQLQTLGFTFRYSNDVKRWCIEGKGTKTINSIQDLIDFEAKWGTIIFKGNEIEIYDDYRE